MAQKRRHIQEGLVEIERLIEDLVEDGISERLNRALDDFKRDPGRFLPPYQPPADRGRLAILQLNLDGTVRYANEVFEKTWGWGEDEIKGVYASAILRSKDVIREVEPEKWQIYEEVRDLNNPRDECHFEFDFEHRDGHPIHVDLVGKLMRPYEFVELRLDVRSDEPKRRKRGRPKGSKNWSKAYFWQQYKDAVDGTGGFPRMNRPYAWTTLQIRLGIGNPRLHLYIDTYGAPPGYAKPRE